MKTLIAVAAVVAVTTGSNVFADSIHSAIEKDRANATSNFESASAVRTRSDESAPWTIQDYVEKFRAEYEASNSESASAVRIRSDESAQWTIQDYVEKLRAEYEASNSESASAVRTHADS